ncbi:MAG: hypothetical protein GC190_15590 [Alphaproteobacteria bacterium]|nr:hypothetical protein [Alphaproteobacteria bacterium]
MTQTPVFLIAFDVAPERHRAMVLAIEALGEWAQLTPTTFAVATNEPAGAIIAKLHRNIRAEEQIFVVSAKGPWAAYGASDTENFLDVLGPEEDWIESS